jgi:hypothetical protein
MLNPVEHALYAGSRNALETLLHNWTDDNEFNYRMVEGLLVHAMFKTAGIS